MPMPPYQQPPPALIVQQTYNTRVHSTHSSIGPFIAVLVVIIVLGILAVMVGRLCFGKGVLGYGEYDIESWVETKCSSCIDGKFNSPPPPPLRTTNASSSCNSIPLPVPLQTGHQQAEQEERSPPDPKTNV